MSTVKFRRPHHVSVKKAKVAAEHVAEELAEKFSFRYEWNGSTLNFSRSGASGQILVHKHDIELTVELNFVLGLMKSKIEREIHRYCDENFGPV